eukprot:SAG11_NODE_1854_length_4165_cov_16.365224_1_plen_425_part_10
MPVIRGSRAMAQWNLMQENEDLLHAENKACCSQDCLPVCMQKRAWAQVLALTIALLLLGAHLMKEAEYKNEVDEAQEYKTLLKKLDDLKTQGHLNQSHIDTLTKFTRRTCAAPQFEDISEEDVDSTDGGEGKPLVKNWDFNGSLWFLVTVFSTIGYGNYTPQTPKGRILVVVLSTAGIPLFAYLTALSGQKILGAITNKWQQLIDLAQHVCGQGDGADGSDTGGDDSGLGKVLESLGAAGQGGGRQRRQRSICAGAKWLYWIGQVSALLGLLAVGVALCETAQVSANDRDPVTGATRPETVANTLYFCFVSMSTIGFGDQHPRIFTGALAPLQTAVFSTWLVVAVTVTSALVSNLIATLATTHAQLLRRRYDASADDLELRMLARPAAAERRQPLRLSAAELEAFSRPFRGVAARKPGPEPAAAA